MNNENDKVETMHSIGEYQYMSPKTLSTILKSEENNLKYLVKELFYENTINLISGESGIGKSLFTQFLAGSLSMGELFMGKFQNNIGTVGFIDAENNGQIIKQRFTTIKSNPDNIYYLDIFGTLNIKVVKEIMIFLSRTPIDILVIDTFKSLSSGDENDSETTREFFLMIKVLLSQVKCIFILHHLKKLNDQKPSNDSARGSSFIVGSSDTHSILSKKSDIYTLTNVKNRIDKQIAPINFEIKESDNIMELKFISYGEIDDPKKALTITTILNATTTKAVSFDDLTLIVKDKGGYSENILRNILKQLVEQKQLSLTKSGNKNYYSKPSTNLLTS